MRLSIPRPAIPLILSAFLVLIAGCGSSPAPTPTPVQVAKAPTATFVPTATTRPTTTPTPVPTATPVASAGIALLEQVQGKQQDVRSARGAMEIAVQGIQEGRPESASISVDFEFNEPDMRMAMKMAGEDAAMPFDMEFILAGETVYVRMGGEWMAFPADESTPGPQDQMGLVNMDELEEFMKEADDVRVVGRRTVKGVECDVIAFTLPEQKLLELARERGSLDEDELSSDDIQVGDFKGEFAIGVQDKMLHQMAIEMEMFDESAPAERITMTFTTTLWDLNSPDIVIEAPAGVTPSGLPEQTPVPRA